MATRARDVRDLEVWQRAHALVIEIITATRDFPRELRFELTSQLRRSAVSMTSNIAEGHARRSGRAFASFLDIAVGSAAETTYLLLLAHDLGHLSTEKYRKLDDELARLRRMLSAFRRRLEQ